MGNSYEHCLVLTQEARLEMLWWIENLESNNGRNLLVDPPQVVIQTDASKSGWGAVCQGQPAGGLWSEKERLEHINLLELKAVYLAIMMFAGKLKPLSIHLQMDNQAALNYIVKMGGTVSREMNAVSKSLWNYLLQNGITITVEYLPGKLNVWADKESRRKDRSEWKLNPNIFQRLCWKRGRPEIDLFASRVTTQLEGFLHEG